MSEFLTAIEEFSLNGTVKECIPYGGGHINGTYRILCEEDGKETFYILQNINKNVFKRPEDVMNNIQRVVEFIRDKNGDTKQTLNFLKSKAGTLYGIDKNGRYWRMYEYVGGADGVDCPTLEEFYQCAIGFGNFQRQLSDFPADTLVETIPDFHNTPKRYEAFLEAVNANLSGRKDTCLNEIEFVKARKDFYPTLINANKEGRLPLRVSHNDTKSNNVLLDNVTKKAVCVIDLDTIMPGFSVTDFGDAIRFGANTAAEDEKDLSKVKFDLEKFRIFAKGFIEGCGGQLPKEEILLLPEGSLMMTLECGMRFLTDYINGDTYFKTAYSDHNLVRCRTQFKLAEEMEKNWDEMKKTVADLVGGN